MLKNRNINIIRVYTLLLALLLTSACTPFNFYRQIVTGHFAIVNKVRPIDQVLLDETVPQAVKDQLNYALQARQYASDVLQLPDNNSYKTYADIGRDTVTYNVFATEEFDLKPVTWCFLVVGCLSYRGYFSQAEAQAFADKLQIQGKDAHVGGSAAYSTLGWFDDPLLNTMLGWYNWQIAGMIFHELAHQQLFISDSSFDEAFATTVEALGLEHWLTTQDDLASLDTFNATQSREADFLAVLQTGKEQLQTLYRSGIDATQMRSQKQAVFDAMRAEHQLLTQKWGGQYYSSWFAQELKNSHLLSVATYNDLVPAFRQLFADAGRDWNAFFQQAESLGKLKKEVRDQQLADLLARWQAANP